MSPLYHPNIITKLPQYCRLCSNPLNGQSNRKSRTLAQLAGHIDCTPMLLNNQLHNVQTQPLTALPWRATSSLLHCVTLLEDEFPVSVDHNETCVGLQKECSES
jgi:hypothetical protein